MALGKLENEILALMNSEIIDINKVEELFKNGADPNALEDDEPDLDFDNNIHWSTFFTSCIFSTLQNNPDFYPLLEVFIKYGLDVNKYGSSLIDDFHFISDRCDIYEMTKLVLNHVTDRTKIEPALSSIDTVESWLNCNIDEICDAESNDFYGLYVLVESFLNNIPYNSFYRLPKQINEEFKNIYVNGNFVVIEKNKLSAKYNENKNALNTKIVLKNNTLIVKDYHSVYINNDDIHNYIENEFTDYANSHFKNEKVIDIKFKHFEVELSPDLCAQGRMVTISFTNKKELKYMEDTEHNLVTVEII